MADRQPPAQPIRRAIGPSLSSPGVTGAVWDPVLCGGCPNSSVEGPATAHHPRVVMLLRG